MAGNKLERRSFLKYCVATSVYGGLISNPIDLFAFDTEKRKKEKFKLSKPRWIIYENGSYDLISEEIILKNCRPAINGQTVMPKNVFLGDSPKGKRIVYELPGGFLMLDLKTNKDTISIGSEFSGFSQAPKWFYPIAQAEVFGVSNFFKQGYGSNGPTKVFSLSPTEKNISHDSFMTFAFLGQKETIAVGNLDHNDFHQRFSLYTRTHSGGLKHENQISQRVFFESGMLLDEIPIENEYIKLPELHFITGNKTFETLGELAWRTKSTTLARQSTVSNFHWISPPKTSTPNCCKDLMSQIEFAKQNKLPLHTFCIKNYCIEGDWLQPFNTWQGGLDRAAREIIKEGFRPGISVAPFRISDKSKLFKQHSDWIIKNAENNISPEETINGENFYSLDLTHQGAQKYISKVFRTLRKMGFIFYETPHLHYGFKDNQYVNRKKTGQSNVHFFRNICQIIRSEIGYGSLWMAGDTPYSPAIGIADIVKINNSEIKEWNSKNLCKYVAESYLCHYLNNTYWQNMPGELTISGNNDLNEDEKNSLSLWCSILGGAVGVSEDLTQWNSEQIKKFCFLQPSKNPENAILPFWPDEKPIKVAVRYYKQQRSWGVLLFNDKESRQDVSFDIFDLIEKEEAFVFAWHKSNLKFGKKTQLSVSLNPCQSMLFFLTEKDEPPHPQLTLGGTIVKNEKLLS